MPSMIELEQIAQRIQTVGLSLRGGFHPIADDAVPLLPSGRLAGTLVLIGNVGAAMWPTFSNSSQARMDLENSLDAWTHQVLTDLAEACSADAVYFPFGGPPHLPFIRWAKRAESIFESPLGMLIHPEHGLWHAYRGALAFAQTLSLPQRDPKLRPCDVCPDQPCLSACPVGAFSSGVYHVSRCTQHLLESDNQDCSGQGCRARRACPIGRDGRYTPAQASYHMHAFLRSWLKVDGRTV